MKRSQRWLSAAFIAVASSLATASQCLAVAKPDEAAAPSGPAAEARLGAFDCNQARALGLEKQGNIRAGLILQRCGLLPAAGPRRDVRSGAAAVGRASKVPLAYGGSDVDIILPDGASPHIVQSGSSVWASGSTIVAHYNDSRLSPACYNGLSTSTDGGATWTAASPTCSGHGTSYGFPEVAFNAKYLTWFATSLASGCGGQGIGAWTSADGVTWAAGACVHSGSNDDRPWLWVDNALASPHYGSMYLSYNDFNVGGGRLLVTRSTDGGTTWVAPVQLSASFVRNADLTVSQNGDGTLIVAAMDEGASGGFSNRTNLFYRSTDGGATFASTTAGSPFYPPGRSVSGYYAGMYSSGYWRYMGEGQAGVGPSNVIHYAYTMGISGVDPGNVMYIRSTDNGITWSAPLQLNTDATTRAQWEPSLAVTKTGRLLASWYDERETASCTKGDPTTPCYRRWGRASTDGGVTWAPDQPIGDVISPLPDQTDSNINPAFVGDADRASADGEVAFTAWVDGRTAIAGSSQQDVYFDKVDMSTVPVELMSFTVD